MVLQFDIWSDIAKGMKNILLICLLILLCGFSKKAPVEIPLAEASPSVTGITIHSMKNYTIKEQGNAREAEKKIVQVVSSECFGSFIKKSALTETNGKTNDQVLDSIRKANASLDLVMYSKWYSKVVGYTYGGTTIYTNRKFHAGATSCNVASNIVHEVAHVIGYSHYKAWGSSVPYQINRAFEACCK